MVKTISSKNSPQKLLEVKKLQGCTIECKINLRQLFETKIEREKFEWKWNDFIASDPANRKVYKKKGNILSYKSEQLIPSKIDQRPPLLLVLGNPATHSVDAGMFFAFEGNNKEHRFWKSILNPSDVLNLPFSPELSVEKLNTQRRQAFFDLSYKSHFRVGLSVIITMPSAPGGKWGGIAGVKQLIGAKALRRLEIAETERLLIDIKNFVTTKGAVITFQKNAWNCLKYDNDPEYNINLARSGALKGNLKDNEKISMYCAPPTRLSGPCCKVLNGFIKEIRSW